ncbi:MAG TPA: hypothetical protein VGQ83_26290 [Polyangia bacterium]|jgi:hypothetical protein
MRLLVLVCLLLAPALAPARAHAESAPAGGFEVQCSVGRQGWCGFGPRLAWRSDYGEVRVLALTDLDLRFRVMAGVEVGTPYYRLSRRVDLALRVDADMFLDLDPRTGRMVAGVRTTIGPNLRMSFADGSSLELRVAVGPTRTRELGEHGLALR